jgi:hypothetical protein
MTANAGKGPPSPCGKPLFRVSRGVYVLRDLDQEDRGTEGAGGGGAPVLPVASPPELTVNVAPFGSGDLPISVIVAWTYSGSWQMDTVLLRCPDGAANHRPEVYTGLNRPSHWDPLAECVRDSGGSGGGDGVSWEVTGYDTDRETSIDALLEVAAAQGPHGPLAQARGLVASGQNRENVASVSAFALSDDGGRLCVLPLDQMRIDRYRISVGYRASVRRSPFHSEEFPRLGGHPCWSVQDTLACSVSYLDRSVDLTNRLPVDAKL